MKKILALFLILITVFAFAACGSKEEALPKTDAPGTSQSGAEKPSNSDQPGKEWPTDQYRWTGSGTIVDVTDNSTPEKTNVQVYISSATLEEFVAYIASLKTSGFAFTRTADYTEEPAAGYDENDYRYLWNGENADGVKVGVTLNKNEQDGVTDSFDLYKYFLEISLRSQ